MKRLSALRSELAGMAALECPATEDSELWACEAEFIKHGKGGEP